MKTLIFAHRGASVYRPENTIEAFALAIEQGADGFELDVHLTKDGEIIVAHDDRLERVSDGTGHINDYTLEELKRLNFGKLFEGKPCLVPTLAEVYSLVKSTEHKINVELKCVERIYNELPEKLIALTKEHGMEDRVIYSSFNHYFLQMIKNIDKSVKTGILYDLAMIDPWVYAVYIGADAIHPHYRIIQALPHTVDRCHEKGIMVNVWTADDPQIIDMMLKTRVDAIISNKPDIAVSCRDNLTVN